MPAKILFSVTDGPIKGRNFSFDEHDAFLLGRSPDCHACIPDDRQISRHHFLLEVNPPQAALRDLGSLNGTLVNGVKYGGRRPDETPEQGANRKYPEVVLRDGDRVQVGRTAMLVSVEARTSSANKVENFASLSTQELVAMILGGSNPKPQKGGVSIPGYEIVSELGRGGFGAVFKGRRIKDGTPVAIKVMLPRVAIDQAAIARFQKEMEIVGRLKHPGIVRVFERGSYGNMLHFVMEFCPAGSLWDAMRKQGGRVDLRQAAPIVVESLAALSYAHEKGYVHRDLKPQNILLTSSAAKVSDFGLAKNFEHAGFSGLTLTGKYAGTPYFMPREQITNFKYLKPASDVWSMGATIYNVLTGAFTRDFSPRRDPIDIILNDEIIPVRKRAASIPKEVAEVIDRAVCDNPKHRYQSATEMLRAFNVALAPWL